MKVKLRDSNNPVCFKPFYFNIVIILALRIHINQMKDQIKILCTIILKLK